MTRIALEELESLIYQRKYFVLHAPRQTGKTSCLLALHDYLNARGEFYAVYANVEVGQASRNNVEEVNRNVPLRISNAIYREIILRELTWTTQSGLIQQSAWYMNPDNSINMEKLLSDFRQFFRENADSWVTAAPYIALCWN